MDVKKKNWSLYNEVTGRQVDGLSYVIAKAFIVAIPESQHSDWLGWHAGLQDWKTIDELSSALELTPGKNIEPAKEATRVESEPTRVRPAINELKKISMFELEEASPLDIQIEDKQSRDRRINTRFAKDYMATIVVTGGSTGSIGSGRIFKSPTLDISLGGMRLKDPVPDGLPKQFNVHLVRKRGHLDLTCRVVPAPHGAPSHRLRIIGAETSELRTWLLDDQVD